MAHKNLPAMLAQQAGVGITYTKRGEKGPHGEVSEAFWRREAEKELVKTHKSWVVRL